MRVIVHDYPGHPFQIHLSRQLAKRGHDVSHMYFADEPGPKGHFERREDDPRSLRIIGVTLGGAVKHAAGTGGRIFAKWQRDLAYGRAASRLIREIRPDIVLCGNTPADAQRAIIHACKTDGIAFVYWLQDVYGLAVSKLLSKKFGPVGRAIGWYYQRMDARQYRSSDGIVVISDDFVPHVAPWAKNVSVIENWAAIDDLPLCVKDNEWSRAHDLHSKFSFLYSGTLGRKHNASLLVKLARRYEAEEIVIVVAQGFGVPQLRAAKAAQDLPSLHLLPLQPAKQLANVMATADVLVATIEADAGTFAVPSKVLSYLCTGRPILLAAPEENLAARTVLRANAGIVVNPDDETGFMLAADRLRSDPHLCAQLRRQRARKYAERVFDMQSRIADRFETMLLMTSPAHESLKVPAMVDDDDELAIVR